MQRAAVARLQRAAVARLQPGLQPGFDVSVVAAATLAATLSLPWLRRDTLEKIDIFCIHQPQRLSFSALAFSPEPVVYLNGSVPPIPSRSRCPSVALTFLKIFEILWIFFLKSVNYHEFFDEFF